MKLHLACLHSLDVGITFLSSVATNKPFVVKYCRRRASNMNLAVVCCRCGTSQLPTMPSTSPTDHTQTRSFAWCYCEEFLISIVVTSVPVNGSRVTSRPADRNVSDVIVPRITLLSGAAFFWFSEDVAI